MVRTALFVACASVVAVTACAPIALEGASSGDAAGDGGAAPIVGGDAGGALFTDSDAANASGASSAAFRAACGDTRGCNPDETAACARASASSDAAPPLADGGDVRDGGGDAAPGAPPSDAAPSPDAASAGGLDAGPATSPLACVPHTSGRAASCVTAGAGRPGAPCASAADCVAGAACAFGRCAPTCCARGTACPTGTGCMLAAATGAPVPWLPVCASLRGCSFEEPFGLAEADAGAPCPSGTQCGFAADEGVRACVPLGRAREGERCEAEPCAPGLACIGSGSYERCARLCATESAQGCPANTRCRAHPALLGTSAVGYCAP